MNITVDKTCEKCIHREVCAFKEDYVHYEAEITKMPQGNEKSPLSAMVVCKCFSPQNKIIK